MRIGIDIDDTITNTWECMKPVYAEIFNISLEELNKAKYPYYYAVKDKVLSLDDFFSMIVKHYDKIGSNLKVKEGAVEVINKLHDEGNKIIIITARSRGYTEPYKITKDFLDRNNIKYDKIIIGANDKSIPCVSEKIDLFIDDSVKHCEEVSNVGIKVVLIGTQYNEDEKRFTRVCDWYQVKEYIDKLK